MGRKESPLPTAQFRITNSLWSEGAGDGTMFSPCEDCGQSTGAASGTDSFCFRNEKQKTSSSRPTAELIGTGHPRVKYST